MGDKSRSGGKDEGDDDGDVESDGVGKDGWRRRR